MKKIFAIIFLILTSCYPAFDSIALTNGEFTIQIPEIELDAEIVNAYISGASWDVSGIDYEVALLEATGQIGVSGNAVIAGHSEGRNRTPLVFYRLDELEIGDLITIIKSDGVVYTYEVINSLILDYQDVSLLVGTSYQMITLITCDIYSYIDGEYPTRLVIQANRIS